MSLSIRLMHFRGGELEELKGKCPQGQWGEGIIPSFLSKPVSPSLLGEYEKPSLSAWPSPVVPLGQAVTLQCHSGPPFVIFRLFKRDGARLRLFSFKGAPEKLSDFAQGHSVKIKCPTSSQI